MHAVISASAIPGHLRGYTSRYLSQVAPNLYVGRLTPRVADRLWDNLCRHSPPEATLTMVRSDHDSETGYRILHHGPNPYSSVEIDGLQLAIYTKEAEEPCLAERTLTTEPTKALVTKSLPRTRGGEPGTNVAISRPSGSSPHARG